MNSLRRHFTESIGDVLDRDSQSAREQDSD